MAIAPDGRPLATAGADGKGRSGTHHRLPAPRRHRPRWRWRSRPIPAGWLSQAPTAQCGSGTRPPGGPGRRRGPRPAGSGGDRAGLQPAGERRPRPPALDLGARYRSNAEFEVRVDNLIHVCAWRGTRGLAVGGLGGLYCTYSIFLPKPPSSWDNSPQRSAAATRDALTVRPSVHWKEKNQSE